VPVSIKDLLFTRRVPTTGGSRLFTDHVPEEDAVSVERLKGAGAIIIGKTTTPEFGHKAVTDSPLFGITRNPWNPALTPGGSSGGAAVSRVWVCSRWADGGGSIRIPRLCGIYGQPLRPRPESGFRLETLCHGHDPHGLRRRAHAGGDRGPRRSRSPLLPAARARSWRVRYGIAGLSVSVA
jgi:hypothetical protein